MFAVTQYLLPWLRVGYCPDLVPFHCWSSSRPSLALLWRSNQGRCPGHLLPQSDNRRAVEQTVKVFFLFVRLVWCLLRTLPSRPHTSLLVFVFHHSWCRGFSSHSPGLQSRPLQQLYLLVFSCCLQYHKENYKIWLTSTSTDLLFLGVKLSMKTVIKRFVHVSDLEQLRKLKAP